MCFKPKIPKIAPDPNITIQQQEAEQQVRDNKGFNKQQRLDEALQMMTGKVGRASLFTGSAGGAGYGAPMAQSLFVGR